MQMSSATKVVTIATLMIGLGAVPSSAGSLQVPDVTPTGATRTVLVAITVDGETKFQEQVMDDSFAPFVQNIQGSAVGEGGSIGTGASSQNTRITTFGIGGEGEVSASVNGGSAKTGTSSTLQISFTVDVDTPFELSGTLDSSGAGFGGSANVSLLGSAPGGAPIVIMEMSTTLSNDGEVKVFETGMLAGGATHSIVLGAGAGAQSGLGTESTASFDIELNLGDRDQDGLLDTWEEKQGIDVNDDGVIDVELEGANPDRKDVYVEIDAMSGLAPNEALLQEVADAFMEAPADQVDNPNGQDGVGLHWVIDETDLPVQAFPTVWPAEVINAIKAEHYGLAKDDQLTGELAELVADAWSRAYRYCVYADRAEHPCFDFIAGIGETPGNDFFVFKGTLLESFPDELDHMERYTFMHELGHNLGLKHGGTDNITFKPNYFSAMNYLWGVPNEQLEPHRQLEYSRWNLPSLDETALNEPNGIGGPIEDFAGRLTAFNVAESGEQRTLMFVPADENSACDWNGDGDTKDPMAMRNLDNWTPDSQCSPPSPADQMLTSAADWPLLWYHLSGHPNFETFNVPEPADLPDEMSIAEFKELGAEFIEGGECVGDLDRDEIVGGSDLLMLLNDWGAMDSPADLDSSGDVNGQDLLMLLNAWGPCT